MIKINLKRNHQIKNFTNYNLLEISGSGLVGHSGIFFNTIYSKFHIGNFTEERYIDILKSERSASVVNYLVSPNFDAQTNIEKLSIQNYLSEAL